MYSNKVGFNSIATFSQDVSQACNHNMDVECTGISDKLTTLSKHIVLTTRWVFDHSINAGSSTLSGPSAGSLSQTVSCP